MEKINTMKLLTLRKDVVTVDDTASLKSTIMKFRHHSYTALPVVDEKGIYYGTLSEGDLLYAVTGGVHEDTEIRTLLRPDFNPPLSVGTPLKEICLRALSCNFVPIVDDRGVLMGIITRKSLLMELTGNLEF